MKVLWLCNSMLPGACERLGLKATNKEGWLVGLLGAIKENNKDDYELAVAAPISAEYAGFNESVDGVKYYGFYEDTTRPWIYDSSLENSMTEIITDFAPDIIHIFGTEYPHTLAMTRAFSDKSKILIGLQGACLPISEHYADGVPINVIKARTFRDLLKKDNIDDQIEKFKRRGLNEQSALKNVENVTGRTDFDRKYMLSVNPNLKYYFMNETLKKPFYEGKWEVGKCEAHSIFLSQGDYPVKGVHYVFEAAKILKEEFNDLSIYIAGNNIMKNQNLMEKLKLPSYGKYLLSLINKFGLKECVHILGSIDIDEMKRRYLNAGVFVCPSTIENSPNSVGEAMLLGLPVVAANVGGVTSVIADGKEGIVYEAGNIEALCQAIRKMWTDTEFVKCCTKNAADRARITHNPETNYLRLLEIYKDICK